MRQPGLTVAIVLVALTELHSAALGSASCTLVSLRGGGYGYVGSDAGLEIGIRGEYERTANSGLGIAGSLDAALLGHMPSAEPLGSEVHRDDTSVFFALMVGPTLVKPLSQGTAIVASAQAGLGIQRIGPGSGFDYSTGTVTTEPGETQAGVALDGGLGLRFRSPGHTGLQVGVRWLSVLGAPADLTLLGATIGVAF